MLLCACHLSLLVLSLIIVMCHEMSSVASKKSGKTVGRMRQEETMADKTAQTPRRRNTKQRQLVLDAVRSRCDHPTADDIYLAVREKDEHISRGTVYRNLNLLAEEGAIQDVHVKGGDRFDLRCDRHAHVVCSECGVMMDAPLPYLENLDDQLAEKTGYAVSGHLTTFVGLCPACQARIHQDS